MYVACFIAFVFDLIFLLLHKPAVAVLVQLWEQQLNTSYFSLIVYPGIPTAKRKQTERYVLVTGVCLHCFSFGGVFCLFFGFFLLFPPTRITKGFGYSSQSTGRRAPHAPTSM